uniref:Uncharacterized protein n=1 Tax=Rhizophora mucronata TaxID=61149 RepID=A0A2P2NHA8_RHIMU
MKFCVISRPILSGITMFLVKICPFHLFLSRKTIPNFVGIMLNFT